VRRIKEKRKGKAITDHHRHHQGEQRRQQHPSQPGTDS